MKSSSVPAWLGVGLGALLVGLVMGSAANRADLRQARAEIDQLKRDLEKQSRNSSAAGMSGIASMLKLPEPVASAPDEPVSSRRRRHPRSSGEVAPEAVSGVDTAGAARVEAPVARRRHSAPHFKAEDLQQAMALWKTRSELARSSFLSNIRASEEQATQFDVAMMAMNMRLSNSLSVWAQNIKQKNEITSEDGIKILNEMSGALVWAYKDMDRMMPPDWRTQSEVKFEVMDFINPEIALPLTELPDDIRTPESSGGRTDESAGNSPNP